MPHELDARGLICPLPVLKARKVLQKLPEGAVLRVLVTDAAAPKDFALFCAEAGHVLQSVTPREDAIEVVVLRGKG
ncbi:MAG: sulfurtransferase TusA family protein [Alphaproteobacteria bacterium]|nr:sulfurtransferase TusA family protein [Alphaproteobacteria bacterium]MDE2336995.1 sulfurtransferase TusA family protein [Alphaproteobacteria bacterium]